MIARDRVIRRIGSSGDRIIGSSTLGVLHRSAELALRGAIAKADAYTRQVTQITRSPDDPITRSAQFTHPPRPRSFLSFSSGGLKLPYSSKYCFGSCSCLRM